MHIIPLGPLMLNFELVTFILSAVVGYLALRYRLRTLSIDANMSTKFVHALIVGFMVWKFSIILFEPLTVIRYPMSLLYYNGGDKGLWLSIIISIVYIAMSIRKEKASRWINVDVFISGVIAGSVPYNAMLLTLDGTNKLLHSMYIILAIGILIIINLNKQSFVSRSGWKQFVAKNNGVAMLAVLALVIAGVYYSFSQYNEANREQRDMAQMNIGIKLGHISPDFELIDMNEKGVKLSDYKGKKVILNFWATWCPPCRVEMPQMVKFYEDYDEEVVVLAVNLTNTEKNFSAVRDFVKQAELNFPVVMDAEGDVSDLYRIIAYPTSYIIDTQGVIQDVFQGAINYEVMKKAITRID